MVATARGFWNSLTNVKFPWPTELTISDIRPDDGLNPPLHLFIYAFSKSSAVYIRSEFLVAFGGVRCRGSAGRLALFAAGANALMLRAGVKNFQGGSRACCPRKFLKIIELSKMQFPAFSGSELVNQEGIMLTKNEILWFATYNYCQFSVVHFLLY